MAGQPRTHRDAGAEWVESWRAPAGAPEETLALRQEVAALKVALAASQAQVAEAEQVHVDARAVDAYTPDGRHAHPTRHVSGAGFAMSSTLCIATQRRAYEAQTTKRLWKKNLATIERLQKEVAALKAEKQALELPAVSSVVPEADASPAAAAAAEEVAADAVVA